MGSGLVGSEMCIRDSFHHAGGTYRQGVDATGARARALARGEGSGLVPAPTLSTTPSLLYFTLLYFTTRASPLFASADAPPFA
eukprot:5077436-Pyramimonas_sp.AAC.1